ncbi:MAG: antitoxin VapB family protein [Candidatus Aenigmarchaeota archaeon]|nr:antitoxin VapB family protein [Candidatus Aenigmarchaeota archaeon]
MATKTITITEDAYGELSGLKLPEESFSEAIKRLSKSKGNLKDCLGLWKDITSEEKKHIEKAISAGRQTTQKILGKLHAHTT